MTREPTNAERAATKLRVVGSLQADDGKASHHGTYANRPEVVRPEFRPCPRCGQPNGLAFCINCHTPRAA